MKNILCVLAFCIASLFSPGIVSCAEISANKDSCDSLKILSYNICNAKGLDNVINYKRIGDIIRRVDADFVALQELDSATVRSNKAVVLNELATLTGMFPTYRSSISFQGGKYGIGILTKEKPLRVEAFSLPGKEEKRSLLILEMKKYVLCCTHFSLTQADRLSSVEIVTNAVKKYSKPVFLAGDLNTEVGTPEMENLKKDWSVLNNPSQFTIPADNPKSCIDFILAKKSANYKLETIAGAVENEPVASDHLPVWVKVLIHQE